MTETKDLLIEIGTEELPPKALTKLASASVLVIGIKHDWQYQGLIF